MADGGNITVVKVVEEVLKKPATVKCHLGYGYLPSQDFVFEHMTVGHVSEQAAAQVGGKFEFSGMDMHMDGVVVANEAELELMETKAGENRA